MMTLPMLNVLTKIPAAVLIITAFMKCASPPAPDSGSCACCTKIVEKPISFSENRVALTLDYRRRHYDPSAKDIIIDPKLVVIHWTAVNSLEGSFRCLEPETLGAGRPDIIKGGAVNVSAHFLVDRDGTVYRLMPETRMARHVIGLNHCAIGIENMGGPKAPLTAAQCKANAAIITCLKKRFPGITAVVGHHRYLAFKGGPLWLQKDGSYRAHKKIDPGDDYMKDLKALLDKEGLGGLIAP